MKFFSKFYCKKGLAANYANKRKGNNGILPLRVIGAIRGLFTTLELVEQPFHAGSLEGLNQVRFLRFDLVLNAKSALLKPLHLRLHRALPYQIALADVHEDAHWLNRIDVLIFGKITGKTGYCAEVPRILRRNMKGAQSPFECPAI